jgi:hypothetical protein
MKHSASPSIDHRAGSGGFQSVGWPYCSGGARAPVVDVLPPRARLGRLNGWSAPDFSGENRSGVGSLLLPFGSEELGPAGVRGFHFRKWPKQSNSRLDFLADALEDGWRATAKAVGRLLTSNPHQSGIRSYPQAAELP